MPAVIKRLTKLSEITSLATALLGASVLLSWATKTSLLKLLAPQLVSMNPLSALGFLAAGSALYFRLKGLSSKSERVTFRILAGFVGLIGFVRLVGALGWDLELDRILFAETIGENRMAPNTALCFLLTSISIFRFQFGPMKRLRIPETACVVVLVLSLLTLVGYLYNAAVLYGVPDYIPMAIHTAFAFAMISSSLLLAQPEQGLVAILRRNDSGGRLARHVLPAVFAIPIVLGWYLTRGNIGVLESATGAPILVVGTILPLAAVIFWIANSLGKAEVLLKQQTELLESIVMNLGEGVVVSDERGHFTLFNPAAEKLTGIGMIKDGPEKWTEKFGVYHNDKVTKFQENEHPLVRAIRGESADNIEMFLINANQPSGIFLSVTARPLRNLEDEIRGAVAVFRDATAEKRGEAEMKAQMQQLQKMDAVGRLAGGVAHDFNNILGAINLYSDLLEEDAERAEMIRSHAADIKRVGERGAALTRQLLVFSRKQILQLTIVDLNALIGSHLRMLSRLIGENIQIRTKLAGDLKGVKVDAAQIEQVILNMVINARDAMPTGGSISISTANVELDGDFCAKHFSVSPGPHVMLTIADTGIGMDQKTQERIFEPFFTTKPVGKGTGLGLSTAYGIIKQARGTIWVYSEPGKGTAFKIYLPAVEMVENQIAAVELKETPMTVSPMILLVEDEPSLRDLCAQALERSGFRVIPAISGEQALMILEDQKLHVDLLLTDVVMPEMSGAQLVRKAYLLKPELKVLFMSGYANEVLDESLAGETGKIAFIEKPFSTKSLVSKVREALGV